MLACRRLPVTIDRESFNLTIRFNFCARRPVVEVPAKMATRAALLDLAVQPELSVLGQRGYKRTIKNNAASGEGPIPPSRI